MTNKALLEWYVAAGVDEAVGDEAVNYFKPAPAIVVSEVKELPAQAVAQDDSKKTNALHHSPSAAAALARELADKASSMEELEAAIRGFDGCAIKKTASKTVFGDGNPKARIMIIGEAPGAQEDVQGIPFCGPSGALLDRMLASIGLDRSTVFISNTVYWRPPGNRQPSMEETSTCLPFVEKMIALVNPGLLILSGGTATTAVLAKDQSISKLRGKFYQYSNPYLANAIPVAVTYHPSYLLRTPAQKKLAWIDLLSFKKFIEEHAITN